MSKNLSRRKFIGVSILSGLSLYVGGWWFFKARKRQAADMIISILHKKLPYLELDETGLNNFALDFQKTLSEKQVLIGKWAGLLIPVYSVVDIFKIVPFSKKFEQFEGFVVTIFLLSSDFFYNGADTSRVIKYRSLYDPFESGCDNPFVTFD